jgi:hypothetical protein
MATPTFHWSGNGATIAVDEKSFSLVEIAHDPLRWAVFEGHRQLGGVRRGADDQTPPGESALWQRIAALLARRPPDPTIPDST